MEHTSVLSVTTALAPAPWVLTGSGYVLLYHFPRAFVEQIAPPFLRGAFRGGLGSVMLVDYQTSPVGPYRELLIVPGLFAFRQRSYFSVSQIYVSSQASVDAGRENWGLPKARADFNVQRLDEQTERIQVELDGQIFADFTLVDERPIRLPFNTRWIPYRATLVQQRDQQVFLTAPYGNGTLSFASVLNVSTDGNHFPDLSAGRLLGAVKFSGFQLHFPVAETI